MYQIPGFGMSTPTLPPMQTQLLKVKDFASAKMYQMAPSSAVALFKEDEDVMYIKTTDASNVPTIRAFKFEEIVEEDVNQNESHKYVTIEEFEKFKEEILNGQQLVRQTANKQSKYPANGKHAGAGYANEADGSANQQRE